MFFIIYQQIYVPINTAEDHWYLMVISLQNGVVYQLDSFCDHEDIAPRRAIMSNLVSNFYNVNRYISQYIFPVRVLS